MRPADRERVLSLAAASSRTDVHRLLDLRAVRDRGRDVRRVEAIDEDLARLLCGPDELRRMRVRPG